MKQILLICPFLLILLPNLHAQAYKSNDPLAHTFSIVARDATTGEMAIGVQSHWFSVGNAVPWAEAGVGVVATQSFVNKSYGNKGLVLLKEGKSPQQALDILLAADEGREYRQVAILDKFGNSAAYTGDKCVKYAGHETGKNFSVQANMMLNDNVVSEMEKAFLAHENLPLPERVLKTMQAAQAAGGDIRGKQSASIMMVKGEATDEPWNDQLFDLRVEDNPEPLQEMGRLLKVYRAYEHMNKGDLAVEKGDMEAAMKEYTAAEEMFPDNLEMKYWHAITLANNGDIQEAAEMLAEIYQKDDNWRKMTERLPASGLLTVDEDALNKLLGK